MAISKSDRASSPSQLAKFLATEDVICGASDHTTLRENNDIFAQIISWREAVIQWFYDVVDHMDERRSIVYVAVNILDRYNALWYSEQRKQQQQQKQHGCVIIDLEAYKDTYKIASMTAIYLAIRVSGSPNLRIHDIIGTNRGYRVEDITSMGKQMLKKLTWKNRLVTPGDFVEVMVNLLHSSPFSSTSTSMQHISAEIRNRASYVVELAVFDASLARVKPSRIALAAMLHVISGMISDNEKSHGSLSTQRDFLLDQVSNVPSSELKFIQSRLSTLCTPCNVDIPIHFISDEEDERFQQKIEQPQKIQQKHQKQQEHNLQSPHHNRGGNKSTLKRNRTFSSLDENELQTKRSR